jgi:hypothetical protein
MDLRFDPQRTAYLCHHAKEQSTISHLRVLPVTFRQMRGDDRAGAGRRKA